MKSPILCLAFLFFLYGCSFGEKEQANNLVEPETIPSTFVKYEIKNIAEKKGPCTTDSTKIGCLIVSINYPILKEGPFQNAITRINRNIKEDIFKHAFIYEKHESFQGLIDEISKEYEDFLEGYKSYSTEWSLEINSDIIYQSPKLISLATSIYSYTGGAHPNSILIYKSYDLETGNTVSLNDIFKEGFEKQLNHAAEIEFRMNHEILPTIKLSEVGYFFEGDQFKVNDNFAIIDQGLIFYFNPYEITGYSQGPDELEIKLTDYMNLIKPGSIIDSL